MGEGAPGQRPRAAVPAEFTAALDAERERQLAKWGDQRHADGTGLPGDREAADAARDRCGAEAAAGDPSWRSILAEEVAEAFAESDPHRLRTELVQAAAVIAAWVHDLDRRGNAPEPG
ncbi:hypothetical protein [Nocardiopsis sp. CC223A]|uniref:hypothetical protein n=1 Tax=Nocardiopsis sp. CC223A TaxID=3044051 RepID=UPI00278C78EB|nr:hypothetical protein [Nocardiopsis sp. CC223A]